MAESFGLSSFYHKEKYEYRFPLSDTAAVVVSAGHTHGNVKRRRNNEDSITLTQEELIQFSGCLPNIAVAVDILM